MKRIKLLLPRLGRNGQIIRNLLVTVLVLCFFWGMLEYPIFDPVLSFRRAEVANMVGPAEIQYVSPTDTHQTVGTYMDQVLIQSGKYDIIFWPRNPVSSTLVPMGNMVLAVDTPQGTVSAQLDITVQLYYFPIYSSPVPASLGPTYATMEQAAMDYSDVVLQKMEYMEATYVFSGIVLDEGGITFTPKAENEVSWESMLLYEITQRELYDEGDAIRPLCAQLQAVFYDGDGNELGRTELKTPDWT